VGNAGRQRHPRPRVRKWKAHELVTTVTAGNHPAFPHAMVLTAYFVLSSVIGLFCHRRRRSYLHRLNTSVEASGPHDFAVRAPRHSSFRRRERPSHPASRFVTIAHTPLLPRRDGASCGFDLPDGTSQIFFTRGLDDPNHVEISCEIGFYAHRISHLTAPRERRSLRQN
jgi:hypothetical protein